MISQLSASLRAARHSHVDLATKLGCDKTSPNSFVYLTSNSCFRASCMDINKIHKKVPQRINSRARDSHIPLRRRWTSTRSPTVSRGCTWPPRLPRREDKYEHNGIYQGRAQLCGRQDGDSIGFCGAQSHSLEGARAEWHYRVVCPRRGEYQGVVGVAGLQGVSTKEIGHSLLLTRGWV